MKMLKKFSHLLQARTLVVESNASRFDNVLHKAARGLYFSSYSLWQHYRQQIKDLMRNSQQKKNEMANSSAALYVHWPYCKKRCSYCNFNKYIEKSVDHRRMKDCLVRETKFLLESSGVTDITSVFFGGGTPSLAEPSTVEALLCSVSSYFRRSDSTEISMEVNPTSIDCSKLRDFKDAGINRVSVGVQTLSGKGLHVLGRDHSVEDSLRTLQDAKSLFPGQVSIDLIFGWPGQTLEGWLLELRQILQLCDNHVSLYQLTLERGTLLFKLVTSQQLALPLTSVSEEMYLRAIEILKEHGYSRYEVSNFSKEDSYSLHNLSYWTGQQYIGVGPGAHGRFTPAGSEYREARIQTLEPQNWMWEVEQYGHATRKRSKLSTLEQLEELLITGLRTKWGVSHEAVSSVDSQLCLYTLVDGTIEMQTHIDTGLLELDNRGLRATPEGMNILDSILVDVLVDLEKSYQAKSRVNKADFP